jgi:hypothetical protein
LHRNVNFGKKLVIATAFEDILECWKRITSTFDALVEFAHVIGGAYRAIFLGSDKTRHTPGGVINSEAKAKGALAFHFLFVGRNIALGNAVRLLAVIGLSGGLQANMKFTFGVATNTSRKKFMAVLKDFAKIIALRWRKVRERVGYLVNVINFVDVIDVMTGSLVERRCSYLDSNGVVA